ncbi:uncharacterized protein Z520_10420 [Fonsecaea multimorphosa CBS 102226]|uniref:Large ribosomal subunit protein mL59 domain-containing protein n=1 Tax=Fonsecaea multimorphosa CBS 102226 TaxID=1442371 RepID=A0A0D2GVZ6_9EURO|nr:uncharacterized protein Z520_10420 [Fonsecaea multimorphosa CBS 102226]KIX93795.1 hypothetical protein Z520_10420 [Fonsecaea multimorphosa CBS 102226]OAL19224.1 hypothetical protein AYO22_09985 [Fonsecaea multimorphosa]
MAELNALPLRLKNFFARYPPQLYSAKFTGITIPLTRREAKDAAVARAAELQTQVSASSTRSSRPVASILAQPISVSTTASSSESEASPAVAAETEIPPIPTPIQTVSTNLQKFPLNPFLPRKNFVTGRWAGPKIGLRRQADLVKLAREFGIEELLPPGKKSSAFKESRLLQRGLRIRGTGEGQKVKGHKWERHMGATLEKRRKAMESMPELIREWKQKGHGRGWKKYPK